MNKFNASFIGFLVAAFGFVAMQFVLIYSSAFTLPALVLILTFGGGLALGIAFREPGRIYYQMGWALGIACSLLIGFILRIIS